MDVETFQESLLRVMDRKTHWAWPAFTSGRVPADRLHVHLEQEYATYVRDFSVFLGRAFVQCPIPGVRADLAENLFEEETGKLSKGRPHSELFLEYPRGLGMDLARFDNVMLLRGAADFRAFVDEATLESGWDVAAAISTIFLEGSSYERGELETRSPKRPEPALAEHPLVKHYGLPVKYLELTRVHRMVEGDHRRAAWRIVLRHVAPGGRERVVDAMERALVHWLAYRDDVASACGLALP